MQGRVRNRSKSRRNALRTLRRRDTVGLLLLGKCESGKTALVKRWVHNLYLDEYEPTVEDFYTKTYKHMGQCVNVGVIDLSGSWDFPAMMDLYLARVDSVMFVYDMGDKNSIKSLEFLYQRLTKIRGENSEILLTIVGTKLEDNESESSNNNNEIHKFISNVKLNCKHIVTSSRLNINVSEAFENALNDIVAYMIPNEDTIKRLGKLMKKNEKKGNCFGKCTIM